MRRRRGRRWLLPIVLGARSSAATVWHRRLRCHPRWMIGRRHQVVQRAIARRLRPRNRSPARRGWACPWAGWMRRRRRACPINLATAMQLAGVRPLDIAAATAQVEQALALQLQAKALWVPNLNGGVDYFRHDGVQQNIFTGPNFRKGRQSFFVGGGPSLSVGLADAIFAPLAARRVVASRQADLQAARNDSLFSGRPGLFRPPGGAGEAARRRGDDRAGRAARELRQGTGPEPDRRRWRSTGRRPSSRASGRPSRSPSATGGSPAPGWRRSSCSTRPRCSSRSSRRSSRSRSSPTSGRPTS